jgi:hypothetical protein
VSVLLGNGAGGFGAAIPFAVGSQPQTVALGDFNRDGILDVAASNFLDGTVSVMLGTGDGTFQPQVAVTTGPGPASVTIADVNRDGKLDILTPNKFNGTVSVLLGNGDGTFQPDTGPPVLVGNRPGGVAVADFDGDGKPDLATANLQDSTVTIVLNTAVTSAPSMLSVPTPCWDPASGPYDKLPARLSCGPLFCTPGPGYPRGPRRLA